MEKIKISKQINEIYDKIISERLLDHTCQFFENKPEGFKAFGSGVFVIIHNIHFILTAAHVANALNDKNFDLFIRIGDEGFINVVGKAKYTDLNKSGGIDLAYIKLDEKAIPPLTKYYKFLTIDKIRKHNKLLVDAANYWKKRVY